MNATTTGILFVCLGNICRSPMAEAIFIHQARARGVLDRFDIDSCGTGHWHVGDGADPRTVRTLERFGVPINHVARQFDATHDPRRFHLIVPMDAMNRRDLLSRNVPVDRLRMMLAFDPDAPLRDVPDPYTGTEKDFEQVYTLLTRACSCMLDELSLRP